jgi:hypothetical protein
VKTTEIRERPILFKPSLVRAILSGAKTQTRRCIVCPQHRKPPRDVIGPSYEENDGEWRMDCDFPTAIVSAFPVRCPYGRPGDRLWVRETWSIGGNGPFYRADVKQPETVKYAWKPSIHMPRKYSRLKLELEEVRAERVQEITAADARAEGRSMRKKDGAGYFPETWDAINKKRGLGWAVNPWVWVLSFKVLKG